MFKIPDWEDSVPASNVEFLKEIKKKQHKPINKNIKSTKGHSELNNNGNKDSKPNGLVHLKQNKKVIKRGIISNGVTNNKTAVNEINISPIKDTQRKHINYNSETKNKKKFEKTQDESRVDTKVRKRQKESDLNKMNDNLNESLEMKNFDTDKLDEEIINAKKRKLNVSNHKEEEDVVEMFKISKEDRKKQLLKNMLQKGSHRNTYKVNGNGLRERMLERLKAAQFRYLNEKLYTSSGSDAKKLFDEDPNAFHTYHEGYQQQVKKWPVKPLDVIVKRILKMPKSHFIADMGCGEGSLSSRIPQKVRSFDLVAFNPNVEVCDIAHTPLLTDSMNVAVYCLALMGTDLTQYMVEANRVLKKGGNLLIAEVESRFDDVDKFINDVQKIGFSLKNLDKSNDVFYFMEFVKVNEPPKKNKLPFLSLKPCFYKKR